MRYFSSLRLVRVVLALAVSLWMAGAGCMLGCETMVSAEPHEQSSVRILSNLVVAGDVCASAHSTDCCKKHGNQSTVRRPVELDAKSSGSNRPSASDLALSLAAIPSSMMDNCPLAVNATAALSKVTSDYSSSILAPARSNISLTNINEQILSLSPPSLLPNRGHTYLRCCVFLI